MNRKYTVNGQAVYVQIQQSDAQPVPEAIDRPKAGRIIPQVSGRKRRPAVGYANIETMREAESIEDSLDYPADIQDKGSLLVVNFHNGSNPIEVRV
jgi:hypothetical protein